MFRAAIAQYPGCGIESNNPAYTINVPLLLTVAGNDDKVSPFLLSATRRQALERRMAKAKVFFSSHLKE